MITRTAYRQISENPHNDWAFWPAGFGKSKGPVPRERPRYDGVRTLLNPRVVFVALNPSKPVDPPRTPRNFHFPDSPNDRRLRDTIQGTPSGDEAVPRCPNLYGGFMTDLVDDQVGASSGEVVIRPEYFDTFTDKLNLLNQPSYHLVCFGSQVYEALAGWMLHEEPTETGIIHGKGTNRLWDLRIYGVYHFAARISNEAYRQQLSEVDALVESAG